MVAVRCSVCGEEFEAQRSSAKYCSERCRDKAWNSTEKAKNARRVYYAEHKEKVLAKSKETREQYTDERIKEIKARKHQYYLDNKEKVLADHKRWKVENEEYYKEYSRNYAMKYNASEHGKYINRMKVHKRRALQKSLEEIDYASLKEKFDRLGNKCVVCGSTKNITIDHIVPITRGGTNDIENLQPLCKSCNSSKCNKTMEEFLEYLNKKKTFERVV